MRIVITGGTGFVGRTIARLLAAEGHELVLIARGIDRTDATIRSLATFVPLGLESMAELANAMAGSQAVVHCAGINRELGDQTFQKVHIVGTRNLIEAAQQVGAKKIVLLSFLRARPNCGSPYHESKWAAEEIVRQSRLDYTVLKCGVIYGQGDHMLNHLSHAFYTFPVFAFVGFRDMPIRPNAVEDVARILRAGVVDGALSRNTVPVLGPEELSLREAVRRVAGVVNRNPIMFPLPIWFHHVLGWCLERTMKVPMVSRAQVRMLCEGLAESVPSCDSMPPDLAPRIRFTPEQIRKGLPAPGPFTWRDLRCSRTHHLGAKPRRSRRVFLEMP
jgi:NADH dehydrogenase